jgi:hypothetical protein
MMAVRGSTFHFHHADRPNCWAWSASGFLHELQEILPPPIFFLIVRRSR